MAKKAVKDLWVLDKSISEFIEEEVAIDLPRAAKIVNLFKEGNEVAYVARYRGDVHGNMTCEQLRRAFEVFNEANNLNKKALKALNSIEAKIENSEEKQAVLSMIKACSDSNDITEVTKMYSSGGKKTKAAQARELGFEEVAREIIRGAHVDLARYVGEQTDSLEKVMEQVKISLADLLNKLQETVEAAKRISKLETRVRLIITAAVAPKTKKALEKGDGTAQEAVDHFKQYLEFKKEARWVQNYQILALERAEEREALAWKVEVNGEDAKREHPTTRTRVHPAHVNLFHDAVEYSIAKLFIPKVQRATRRFLIGRAEQAAIQCFSRNVGQLFARSAVPPSHIVALDPGFSACKAAFLSPTGAVIATDEFGLRNKGFDPKGVGLLRKWAESSRQGSSASSNLLIAIGDGKASYETQCAVADMIKRKDFGPTLDVSFCVVPENGASKYSITDLAEEDLPGMPPTQRSAVSIGRRVIDPMGEYVKIEPRHLGMGMYQHSVNTGKLTEALEQAVRERVSMRGVNVNSASEHLLRYVCGLNKKTAAGVVALREKLGRISSRSELLQVKGLGKTSFTQCAEPPKKKAKKCSTESDWNPLDGTIVHPDQYELAKSVLNKVGLDWSNFDPNSNELVNRLIGFNEFKDEERIVVELFCTKPHTLPPPPFMKEVRKMASLRVGETVIGRIVNQTDFGLFVDIGVEKSALAHKSKLVAPYPEVGSSVNFRIESVDTSRGRIGIVPLD
ncbi:unnamed protein product [Caenorhabditis auriculariae]|uniref:S1 motif domain-containing protein n=1 Tax=Caenorhabditis auriculariae TaxID=2777116 RepID=A0A8S1GP55_9PELO|nr:unnamed protein product [Caenorhabditis auriculariae]